MRHFADQRCYNHGGREAVACCTACGHCFCRECIVEHDDRIVCAACLGRLTQPIVKARRRWSWLVRLGLCGWGMATAWMFFQIIAEGLLRLPSSFHEGTVWRTE